MPAGPVLSLGHALRRAVLGQGPLKRTCDRAHVLLRGVLVLVVVAAPSVGAAVGGAVDDRLTAAAAEWREVLVQEQAVLLADPERDSTGIRRAPARWPAPAGGEVRGSVTVGDGLRAGDRVTVWVTPSGAVHAAPATRRDVVLRSTTAGLVTAVGFVLLGVVGYAVGVALLDRSRDRMWTAEWERVEPVWRAGPAEPSPI